MADPTGVLGDATWPEVAGPSGRGPVVVVPVGSFEQHGPHLPLDTDTRIATALADTLVSARPACVRGPVLTVAASGEHQGFPGTLSIGVAATTEVLVELARSADWAAGLVFVNGHGGNAAAFKQASAVIEHEGRAALFWSPRVPGGDLHAGRTETALMLHLAPHVVRIAAAVPGPQPPVAELVAHGVRALSASGVLGDPTGATAAEGAELFDALAADLVAAYDGWHR